MRRYESWGRYPKATQEIIRWSWRDTGMPASPTKTMLPFGNGRSYGDCCLNDQGMLLDVRGLDRLISFDSQAGTLRCEAGVLFSEILDVVLPQGFFVPVTPGTQYVTIAGAVANDVHGKNHHRAGSFGRHVTRFELCRSNGTRLTCSSAENPDWFRATVGGLGLTGLITWVELQLKRVCGPFIDQETIRFGTLKEYFQLAFESDPAFEYTVAWIDCTARGTALGRGLFIRGNHSAHSGRHQAKKLRLRIPSDCPVSLVNSLSLRLFNALYFRTSPRHLRRSTVHHQRFFYPLDAIEDWNRLYGRRGLLQYQCVVPGHHAEAAISEMLTEVAESGTGSFLAVLKTFGDLPSPGLLSFARPGVTLALDFPNLGQDVFDLLDRLDVITTNAGGALYPAKDARMSPATFQKSFPKWRELEQYVDPLFSSSLWRRCGGAAQENY